MQGATLETTGQLLPGYTHCWSPVLTAGRQSFYDATYIHTHLTVYTYDHVLKNANLLEPKKNGMRKRLVIMMCSGLQLQAQVTMIQQILREL